MFILHDPRSADYEQPYHVERPERVLASAAHLRERHKEWNWIDSINAESDDKSATELEAALRSAHTEEHVRNVKTRAAGMDFDSDTPAYPNIYEHACRSVRAALEAVDLALKGQKPFSLMRPPGHHATSNRAMGFCFFNSIAIAAIAARTRKEIKRVAVWDFDVHHGNGTEAIFKEQHDPGLLYVSVHQYPAYPGTGRESEGNIRNYPVPPYVPSARHMGTLQQSWQDVVNFKPGLILISAGFDAYEGDPITQTCLTQSNFRTLGTWIHDAPCPVAAILEGGYSDELPLLIENFLLGWEG